MFKTFDDLMNNIDFSPSDLDIPQISDSSSGDIYEGKIEPDEYDSDDENEEEDYDENSSEEEPLIVTHKYVHEYRSCNANTILLLFQLIALLMIFGKL